MNTVIIDDATRGKLANLDDFLTFCDSTGRTLGIFFPGETQSVREVFLNLGISEEELRRREQGTEWYSTAEVLDKLNKLA